MSTKLTDIMSTNFSTKGSNHTKPTPGADDKQKEDEEGLLGILQFYRSSATIHGIAQVGRPPIYKFRRWIWLLLVIAMSIGLCVFLFKQVARLADRPYKTSIKAEFENSVPFPAVTLCNLNQFYRDRIPDDPGLRHMIKLGSEFYQLTNKSTVQPVDPFLLVNSSNGSSGDGGGHRWSTISGPELVNISLHASHRLSKFLHMCSWQSEVIPCEKIFHPRLTDLGLCYTFNDFPPDRNSSSDGESSQGESWQRWNSSTFGSWTGLRVLVNIEQDQYYYSKTMQAGVKVVFHEPGFDPMPLTSGMALRPGVSAELALKRTEQMSLSAPYKAYKNAYCVDTTADDYHHTLKRYASYTETVCYKDCMLNTIVAECNCTSPWETQHDLPVCSVDQMIDCYIPAYYAFSVSQLARECVCPPPCQRVVYAVQASYADFASDFSEQQYMQRWKISDQDFLRNAVDVRVFLDTLLVVKIEQEPEMTITDILGTLGGHLGLFLGASILSITELTEMIILLLMKCLGCLLGGGGGKEGKGRDGATQGGRGEGGEIPKSDSRIFTQNGSDSQNGCPRERTASDLETERRGSAVNNTGFASDLFYYDRGRGVPL